MFPRVCREKEGETGPIILPSGTVLLGETKTTTRWNAQRHLKLYNWGEIRFEVASSKQRRETERNMDAQDTQDKESQRLEKFLRARERARDAYLSEEEMLAEIMRQIEDIRENEEGK